jgi:hypothetical protein
MYTQRDCFCVMQHTFVANFPAGLSTGVVYASTLGGLIIHLWISKCLIITWEFFSTPRETIRRNTEHTHARFDWVQIGALSTEYNNFLRFQALCVLQAFISWSMWGTRNWRIELRHLKTAFNRMVVVFCWSFTPSQFCACMLM